MISASAVAASNEIASRHLLVVMRRMEALENAIRSRSWEDTEFAHDQVASAIGKLHRVMP